MIKIQNPKQYRFGHLRLGFGIYLEFGIWNLGFQTRSSTEVRETSLDGIAQGLQKEIRDGD
jgi:hypothetical protein